MPDLHPIVLRTPRLRLRWLDEGDTDALFAMFSDPAVTRYWSTAPWTERAQAEEVIARTLRDYRDGSALSCGVEIAGRPGVIGTANLHRFSEQNRRCEVGYALASAHWGKGYATEAIGALLAHAFDTLGLNRIEADIDPRNEPSGRVLERLGFRKEGYMPERWIVDGETADTVFYGLLKRHWDERKQPGAKEPADA